MSTAVEQIVKPYHETNRFSLYEGDCRSVLPFFADNSFDSIVTDPPAGISFMGKDWDHHKGGRDQWVAWLTEVMRECLRVLKPGGHALVWAIPRTSHWTGWAIESAGFEVRDRVSHLFGSGFPKSLDISKEISRICSINLCECGDYAATKNNRTDAGFSRNDAGFETGENERASRMHDPQVETETEQAELSESARSTANDMRELQSSNRAEGQRVSPLCESVLQPQLCGSVSEEKGQRNATIREGMEGDSPSGQRQRRSLPSLRREGRTRAPGSPSCAVSDEWSKHDVKSSQPLPLLPHQNRKNNGRGDQQDTVLGSFGAGHIDDSYLCPKCGGVLRDIGGTALKPACEDWWLCRKPLEGTVAQNILKHGTGGLNIAACRVEGEYETRDRDTDSGASMFGTGKGGGPFIPANGRWPSNICHDGSEEVLAGFPETETNAGTAAGNHRAGMFGIETQAGRVLSSGSNGSAARFFYCAKASQEDRNEGLEDLPMQSAGTVTDRKDGSAGLNSPRAGAGRTNGSRNPHPTVKPTDLMRYLCRPITPPGGIVLDPFCGSGSTGKAAMLEGFKFVGIELSADYCQLAQRRIEAVTRQGLLFA